MPRPRKWRRVCKMPENTAFGPLQAGTGPRQFILMTVDEYEAIRLIDLLGLTQEECAQRMNVARTTAQAIYIAARKKLAECLVNGLELRIDGGEYRLCDDDESFCGCGHCRHRRCAEQPVEPEEK